MKPIRSNVNELSQELLLKAESILQIYEDEDMVSAASLLIKASNHIANFHIKELKRIYLKEGE